MDKKLFEASLTGDVQLLNELLEKDELILDRVSLARFSETPLHVAALRGHLDFTKILLSKKPALALSRDSTRQIPLHVTSAQGHVEIARELLKVMSVEELSLRDQDGRTPLNLAAKNEQLEIIKLLIETKLDVGKELLENGESILHTCISYNSVEAFKLLCQVWNEDEVGMLKDSDGNTLLHLAAVHKQVQTVKYLLQKPSIRTNQNVVNRHGFTALDVLDHSPLDFKSLQIQTLLMQANFHRSKHLKRIKPVPNEPNPSQTKPKGCTSRIWNWYLNTNGNWLEKQRRDSHTRHLRCRNRVVLLRAPPPGGTFTNSRDGPLGNAVKTEPDMGPFNNFVIENTIILILSLMILVVLLSGIPLRNKFCLWVLNLATLCVIFFATVCYLREIGDMSPDSWVNPTTMVMGLGWLLLCLVFGFVHTVLFVIWVVKKVLIKGRTRTRESDSIGV